MNLAGVYQVCDLNKMSGQSPFTHLKSWARAIKRDVVALWLAARDPRVPWYAKVVAGIVAAYALSPIDLIPDFVPIVGYVDDLVIVPLGILLAVRLIPANTMDELRARAADQPKPISRVGLIAVLVVWLVAIAAAASLLWRTGLAIKWLPVFMSGLG